MNNFQFPGQTHFYKGKVRDVYSIGKEWLVMIASDRISAFDVILPRPIPYKGQVLNQIAAFMLRQTEDICPNWLRDVPAPNTSIGLRCEPFKIEMVVRGNLVGHGWRTYQSGARSLCGATMPDGMKENDFFPDRLLHLPQKPMRDMMRISRQVRSFAGGWQHLKNGNNSPTMH